MNFQFVKIGLRAALLALPCFLASGVAQAQAGADLHGTWTAETKLTSPIRFYLSIGPGPDGQYTCRLKALQGDDGTADESCEVVRVGNKILILSTVVSSSSRTWIPDNFRLVLDGNTLKGNLETSSTASVSFQRFGS